MFGLEIATLTRNYHPFLSLLSLSLSRAFYVNTVLDVKPSQLGISDTLNARSLCGNGVWQIPVHYALLRFTAFFLCFTCPISLARQKKMFLQPVDRHFAEKRRRESVADF